MEDALRDSDEAIKVDPLSLWGYERRHAALHALQRYDEAIEASTRMHSVIEGSLDPDICKLGKKYVSPTRSKTNIDNVVSDVFKIIPLVLIDVKNGRLCYDLERSRTFESEVQFKDLVSSMTDGLDIRRTQQVAEEYSLIGMFKSDIRPDYGEGYAALGHLLEEIVARSSDVTVLAWTGQSSPYNSCLPATLAVYSQPPRTLSAIEDTQMDGRVTVVKGHLSQTVVIPFHERVVSLPPARFDHRRLHLPCIIFAVKRLGIQDLGHGQEYRYRARVSGVGHMEFQTADRLSLTEPRKLIFVHPWIRDLCDPSDGFIWVTEVDDSDGDGDDASDSAQGSKGISPTSPLHAVPAPTMDDYTRALRLVVRLQQPFHALLLQQQPTGEYKRVATEHDIVIPGIERQINFARDVGTGVVEIL
ncbi:hypothetical protein V8E55_007548 [Tylopilus felleus]